MRKLATLLSVILVFSLTLIGNSESQMEDVSMTNPPEQPPTETIVYYYFIDDAGTDLPTGSVIILPDILILAPAQSEITRVSDPVVNICTALQVMIDDPRNEWTSDDLAIIDVAFEGGHATVTLQGEISGAGDIVLIASRMQILMTVFAVSSVNTATVTLNGECIGNLGISHESEARPADYAFARIDIEAFMVDDAPEQH